MSNPGWQNYGIASVFDILGDHIVYRSLQPMDSSLPGLNECRQQLQIGVAVTPRKTSLEYARVIEKILLAVHPAGFQRLIYIGDTLLNDGSAFRNLAEVGAWDAVAFIASEQLSQPPVMTWHPTPGKILRLFTANRWSLINQFHQILDNQNFKTDASTALVIDLDKTTLGARGRNDRLIDDARLQAAYRTAAEYFTDFEPERFNRIYDTLNQPTYHPITADNQDFLVYICLLVYANLAMFDDLLMKIGQDQIGCFADFEQFANTYTHTFSQTILPMRKEFQLRLAAGDPTPFKQFRQNEYLNTVRALQADAVSSDPEILLTTKLVMTAEVKTFADFCKNAGATLFTISDKPDEASVPTPELAAEGYLPLHRVQAFVVGSAK